MEFIYKGCAELLKLLAGKLLGDLGLHSGDKVCLRIRNSLELMVNFYAILAE